MRASLLVLVFVQLWNHVHVSPLQDACAEVPVAPHAHVTLETIQAEYLPGDVIHYECEAGYISGPTTRFRCTIRGWESIHAGKCYLKPCELPENTPNGNYQLIHGEDFVFGTTIKYVCDEGYQMVSMQDTRTCMLDGWTNHVPICDPLSCERPVAEGVTVKGLPDGDEHILPDRFLTFSCEEPRKVLSGRRTLVCGKDGQWDHPFPTCEDVRCEVEALTPSLTAERLTPANTSVAIGHKLRFYCRDGRILDGNREIRCLDTGLWSAAFPTCTEPCLVTETLPGVILSATQQVFTQGEKLSFSCRLRSHMIQGRSEVTCMAGGRWSHPFPTCGPPVGCDQPPPLVDGDTKLSLKFSYRHGETVEHICQRYYKMKGSPLKTCSNGEWVGDMTCLKPCTVDRALMSQHNIHFRFTRDDKIYSTHNDVIEFACSHGRSVGSIAMRQKCIDGAITLPTCR